MVWVKASTCPKCGLVTVTRVDMEFFSEWHNCMCDVEA